MSDGGGTAPVRDDEVVIAPPTLSRTRDGGWRVEANVDGMPAWFESANAALSARPEAFAAAFLGPALSAGRAIRIEAPLDPVWHRNVSGILPVWRQWWGYDLANPIRADEGPAPATPAPTGGFTASCFSGGADSFYTLLRSPRAASIERLLFIQGFDIPLDDERRFAAWEPTLRRVGEATSKPAIVVRTNLRTHPLFKASEWERTHGGALVAVGNVLAGCRRLIIPSTYTYDHVQPWGSHHETDALWSSATLEVIHDDASLNRRDKLRAIADEPLTWDALRVCWEKRTPTGNCSMCEKCVRTMLTLHQRGALDRFTVFDRMVPVAQRITDLRRLRPHLWYVYEGLLRDGLRGDVRRAVRRLLADSKPPTLTRRAMRKAGRVLRALRGETPRRQDAK